jgi:hypothetical protein
VSSSRCSSGVPRDFQLVSEGGGNGYRSFVRGINRFILKILLPIRVLKKQKYIKLKAVIC